ncbi:LysR substrate-binding domain-containing protein [Streptomyces sp. NPDC092129]|uniref:LysR substrate-binding domain-containing protein n=1 Tax=Streptomyces sp. NPDC092129 TaxID=3366010 RepID=UPI00382DB3E7
MELRELRAFIAVAEKGSMSAAARHLHISQSALSQTVGALERQLRLKLLIRSSTGVRPTEEGKILLMEARAILSRHEQAMRTMTTFTGDTCGVLRIGIPLELPTDLLGPALEQMASACPETRVQARHLSTAAQLAALQNGELDVGLLRERPIAPELDAMLLARENLGVLITAEQASEFSEEDGIRLETLTHLEWLAFPRSGSPAWYDQVTAVLRSHGLNLGPEPPEDQTLIAGVKIAAVRTGKAFALAPPNWPHTLPDSIGWSPLVGHPLVRRTWAVWPANARSRDLANFISGFPEAITY